MDKALVINLTTITQHVGVIHEDGRKDDVQIMPRRRVELRIGMTVDPAWLGRNPNCVRVVVPKSVVPVAIAVRRDPEEVVVKTVADLPPGDDSAPQITVDDLASPEAEDADADEDKGDA